MVTMQPLAYRQISAAKPVSLSFPDTLLGKVAAGAAWVLQRSFLQTGRPEVYQGIPKEPAWNTNKVGREEASH